MPGPNTQGRSAVRPRPATWPTRIALVRGRRARGSTPTRAGSDRARRCNRRGRGCRSRTARRRRASRAARCRRGRRRARPGARGACDAARRRGPDRDRCRRCPGCDRARSDAARRRAPSVVAAAPLVVELEPRPERRAGAAARDDARRSRRDERAARMREVLAHGDHQQRQVGAANLLKSRDAERTSLSFLNVRFRTVHLALSSHTS
jgi:hypothetical protein